MLTGTSENNCPYGGNSWSVIGLYWRVWESPIHKHISVVLAFKKYDSISQVPLGKQNHPVFQAEGIKCLELIIQVMEDVEKPKWTGNQEISKSRKLSISSGGGNVPGAQEPRPSSWKLKFKLNVVLTRRIWLFFGETQPLPESLLEVERGGEILWLLPLFHPLNSYWYPLVEPIQKSDNMEPWKVIPLLYRADQWKGPGTDLR